MGTESPTAGWRTWLGLTLFIVSIGWLILRRISSQYSNRQLTNQAEQVRASADRHVGQNRRIAEVEAIAAAEAKGPIATNNDKIGLIPS